MSATETSGSAPVLRVASWNTSHRLSQGGLLLRPSQERVGDRNRRIKEQVELLRGVEAGIICLQEVNPLPFRAYWYAEKLSKKVFYAAANQGLKLFWGPPFNLNEGLAILLPSGSGASFVGKKRLSGTPRLQPLRLPHQLSSLVSFQIEESRCAIAARLPARSLSHLLGGKEVSKGLLVVNTQLHCGHWASARNLELLENARRCGELSDKEAEQVESHFRRTSSRRVAETEKLVSWIRSLRRQGEAVLLCGSFHCDPEAPPLRILKEVGFMDLWSPSKNVQSNQEGHTWVGGTPVAKSIPFLERLNCEPRRSDFLLFLPPDESSHAVAAYSNAQLFGQDREHSDHSGLWVDLAAKELVS